MNEKQKLRYMINLYGDFLHIKDLYPKLKKYVWKIKKAEELSDEKIKKIVATYRLGIQGLETGSIDWKEAKDDMELKFKD